MTEKADNYEYDSYVITAACINCNLCIKACRHHCIDGTVVPPVIDQSRCVRCGECYYACPPRAIMRRED